ncbi:MAG: hypothetical protein A3J55_02330 [Candidatus Ryanbacteria bacterium RIFCSPHIGHO2_02_FULL_45_17b]|uniref:Uncharacterized protein n=1 Tax=Candidatus Ryanbacteria bacterium RIFCSPHIGHO2_01_FULL_45_22 TaxID=1802114 RepID=A0A1G2FYR5_9BACT|nr:MAG: hypothetical protein A2719_00770 [Candidatus Ryanbacteria bacterium RIFCSPHIGHO2_01_FULL_45_22]OGZ46770.1 MAG: hypothetical protein A3J55_02330 [Candidatus Ryanbacteria bacterium RIFCSPHIGHO2_02_FULL_45_17b]
MTLTQQDLEAIQKIVKSEIVPIHHDVKELKEDVSGLREIVQSLAISVDKLVKANESLQQEYSLLVSEMKLHEVWIQQIAEKVGVQLRR